MVSDKIIHLAERLPHVVCNPFISQQLNREERNMEIVRLRLSSGNSTYHPCHNFFQRLLPFERVAILFQDHGKEMGMVVADVTVYWASDGGLRVDIKSRKDLQPFFNMADIWGGFIHAVCAVPKTIKPHLYVKNAEAQFMRIASLHGQAPTSTIPFNEVPLWGLFLARVDGPVLQRVESVYRHVPQITFMPSYYRALDYVTGEAVEGFGIHNNSSIDANIFGTPVVALPPTALQQQTAVAISKALSLLEQLPAHDQARFAKAFKHDLALSMTQGVA